MKFSWTPLQAVLSEGPDIDIDDQSVWQGPIDEFGMDVRLGGPLVAKMQLLPQEDGLLVRGQIKGRIIMPCNLCTEDAAAEIDHRFDSFEPFPAEPDEDKEPDSDVDEYFIRVAPHGNGLEINLGALAWEEFLEALPQYPLCKDNCAGICPECGKNRNSESCGCSKEAYDPRMDKLLGLKINK